MKDVADPMLKTDRRYTDRRQQTRSDGEIATVARPNLSGICDASKPAELAGAALLGFTIGPDTLFAAGD